MFSATYVHMDHQATSRESLLALYGAVEYPWMLWSAPISLALRSMVR